MIGLAAAVLSAALYAAAVPPWSVDALAPVSLVPLLLALRGRRALPALGLGAGFGLALAVAIAGWVPAMIGHFFAVSAGRAVAGTAAVFLLNAGMPFGAFAVGAARLLGRRRALAYIGVPALWVTAELMRADGFTGLPWELLGHALYRRLPLIQVADVTGVYGLSFLCALTALAAADLLRPLGRGGRRPALVAVALTTVLWIGVADYGRSRLASVATSATMPVALVQANRGPARQPSRLRRTETLQAYVHLTRAGLAGRRPELVVWPENTASFYLDEEPEPLAALRHLTDETGGVLLVGGPRRDEATGTLHNSAYEVGDAGVLGTYDKVRLVPFAEYAPFALHALSGPSATFTPGRESRPVPHPRGPLGVLICYEVLHPDLARALVRHGARLLVNISNDAWADPTGGSAALQTLSMAVFRAVEARRWVVRAATTGISARIAPTGEVGPVLGAGAADVLAVDVAPLDALTPYVRLGDVFAGSCALVAFLVLAATVGRRVDA
jgi:apolipoprotein N-acyltransferase